MLDINRLHIGWPVAEEDQSRKMRVSTRFEIA